jgi:hypothetical protein
MVIARAMPTLVVARSWSGMTLPNDDLVAWLLEGDPSIRWRVHRDLLGSSEATVRAERASVANEGWAPSCSRWGGGDYSPKWISTMYTLLHLLWLGLPPGDPAALAGCERLWEWQNRWRVPETCIASMLVRLTAAHRYEVERLDDLVDYLLDQQLADGGWNCTARGEPGKHSSFHTTIQALEALYAYQQALGGASQEAQARGPEFFLQHRLYKSHARAGWQFGAVRAFPSFRSGTSMCCVGSSTSWMWAQIRTSGSQTRSRSCGTRVEPTAGGRPTPDTPAGPGSGWRNRVRAGGTPCEYCAC